MAGTFYTADPHLFHELVAKQRGFENGDAWAAHWAENWRKQVRPKDTAHILGDIAASNRGQVLALELLAELPGKKHLIAGHDPVHPCITMRTVNGSTGTWKSSKPSNRSARNESMAATYS